VIGSTIGNLIAGGISYARAGGGAQFADNSAYASTLSDASSGYACATGTTQHWYDGIVDGWNNFWSGAADFVGSMFGGNRTNSPAGAANEPPLTDEDIVVWGQRVAASGGYQPSAVTYFMNDPEALSHGDGAYVSAAPYPNDVWRAAQNGWNSAVGRLQHDLSPQAVRDPFGAMLAADVLGLALEPAARGIGAMATPLFPDSDGEWASLQNNRAHPSIWDPQHAPTGQERRDLFGAGVVGLATLRLPIGGARAGLLSREIGIADDAFVRFDPSRFDHLIDEQGLLTSVTSDGKIWLTRYSDVSGITSASDLETVLFRRNLWPETVGKFDSGATLRIVQNVNDPVPAGVTNVTNGVRQWYTLSDIPPKNAAVVYRLSGKR
jgi:hypothetical protein